MFVASRDGCACRPHAALGRHVKDGHVKDAAQDGGVKVFILPVVIFRRRGF